METAAAVSPTADQSKSMSDDNNCAAKPILKTYMLIIDPQIDFHPGGTLAVPGAIEDSNRIAELIVSKGKDIDNIIVTLDTHVYTHIAHSIMWKDAAGNNPPPFTLISAQDVREGKWRAAKPSKQAHYQAYCDGLEDKGRFQLCIWPQHCIQGTDGHAIYPALFDALNGWSLELVRNFEIVEKGINEDTEMYSALQAEYQIPSDPSTMFNEPMISVLDEADRIIVCGQALSHCVNFTVRDIVARWKDENKDCTRMILLSDGNSFRLNAAVIVTCFALVGSSAVSGFEQSASSFVSFCEENGIRVINTAELISRW
jgi:nicotinamidase/pyrazinamidase